MISVCVFILKNSFLIYERKKYEKCKNTSVIFVCSDKIQFINLFTLAARARDDNVSTNHFYAIIHQVTFALIPHYQSRSNKVNIHNTQ